MLDERRRSDPSWSGGEERANYFLLWWHFEQKNAITVAQLRACCQLHLLVFDICSQPNVITQNPTVEPSRALGHPCCWLCMPQATADWCRDRIWRPMTGIRRTPLRIFLKVKGGKNHRCHFFLCTGGPTLIVRARRWYSLEPKPSIAVSNC
jgi:hypothetical protein